MLTVDVRYEEWHDFVELSERQMTPRYLDSGRWVAVFSTNSRGKEWSFAGWGNTPLNERIRLKGIKFLESVKKEYLAHKYGRGGRVFVNAKGAYKTRESKPVRFAVFRFPSPVPTGPADEGAAAVHENADSSDNS
jgi:hypothetical protein